MLNNSEKEKRMWLTDRKEYKPYKMIIEPKGEKDSPIGKAFQWLCYLRTKKLKDEIVKFMLRKGYKIETGKDYIYCTCEGSKEKRVMLTAHIDTVQDKRGAKVIFVNKNKKDGKHYLWSPYGIGGDDRCGIYAIFEIVSQGYRPTLLFCDKEESGGDGSIEFAKVYNGICNPNCILELDRKGNNELVFYEEDNEEWQEFLIDLTGWEKSTGSFSDICNLYDLGCASVNLSIGYYNQHTKDEYVIWEDLENSIEIVKLIIDNIDRKWDHISFNNTLID